MDTVKHDTDRERRCGIPEVVLGERKSIENLLDVTKNFLDNSGRVIITRIGQKTTKAVLDLLENDENFNENYKTEYNSRGAILVIKNNGIFIQLSPVQHEPKKAITAISYRPQILLNNQKNRRL